MNSLFCYKKKSILINDDDTERFWNEITSNTNLSKITLYKTKINNIYSKYELSNQNDYTFLLNDTIFNQNAIIKLTKYKDNCAILTGKWKCGMSKGATVQLKFQFDSFTDKICKRGFKCMVELYSGRYGYMEFISHYIILDYSKTN